MTVYKYCPHCQARLRFGVKYDSCPKCHGSFAFNKPTASPAAKSVSPPIAQTSTATKKRWVAVAENGRYMRWTEHEYDMTGYGGSTGSTFRFSSGTDLATATFSTNKDFPPFPPRYGKVQYRRVAVITTFKLLKP